MDFVDFRAGFVPADLGDGTHPTDAGYLKQAARSVRLWIRGSVIMWMRVAGGVGVVRYRPASLCLDLRHSWH